MNTKTKLGLRIKTLRKAKGLTQEELAEAAGISLTFMSVTERGRHIPSLKTCELISNALGVTLSELFNFDEFDGKEKSFKALSFYLRGKEKEQVRFIREIAEKVAYHIKGGKNPKGKSGGRC